MEKLKVTLEDRPVDVELAQYKRMFEAACSALAAIGDALGVDPEEGGAEPILSAITALREALGENNERCILDSAAGIPVSNEPLAEQEPVAWMVTMENQDGTRKTFPLSGRYKDVRDTCDFGDPIPLYAAPQPVKQEPVAFHRASFLSGYEAAQSDANACDVPPQGWICTRQAGHDGPCAAIEDNNGHELVSRAMSRLAEQDAAPVRTKDLTNDDLEKTYDEICRNADSSERLLFRYARAVIAADREKNRA